MKKILILTLGVGRKALGQDQYPYDKTNYIVEIEGTDQTQVIESEYVAEIQISKYQPDMVIIVGTVRSGWGMFYRKFTQESHIEENERAQDMLRLSEIEENYGKDTDNNTLKELEKEIQQIYNHKLILTNSKKIEIRICLIRYGINQAELLENYRNISDIENYLDKDEEYDVAFDITHSFRSLPIYNLVILNYLQMVSSYKMNISHIYYGNFDVKAECDNKASLVDLADISEVLKLTNAVSEFKNTGNAISLIRMLPPVEEPLIRALEKFDMATQMNGRNEVIEALKQLSDVLNQESVTRNRYVDVKTMLKTTLGAEPNNILKIVDCPNKGEAQLMLVKWYQRQNRYGLAVATATEALRSLLIPYYLQLFHREETDYENENRRKEAVQRLGLIVKAKDRWMKSEITDFLIELENLRNGEIKDVRNIFAHNLLKQGQSDSKTVIDSFVAGLERLNTYMHLNEKEFMQVYGYTPQSTAITKKTGEGIRVFISDRYDTLPKSSYEGLEKSINRKYTVYRLPDQIVGRASAKTDANAVLRRACILCEYLKRHFDKENVQIVFDGGLKQKKWMNYSMILYQNHFSNIYVLEDVLMPVSKPVFSVSYDGIEQFNEGIIELEPILYVL